MRNGYCSPASVSLSLQIEAACTPGPLRPHIWGHRSKGHQKDRYEIKCVTRKGQG